MAAILTTTCHFPSPLDVSRAMTDAPELPSSRNRPASAIHSPSGRLLIEASTQSRSPERSLASCASPPLACRYVLLLREHHAPLVHLLGGQVRPGGGGGGQPFSGAGGRAGGETALARPSRARLDATVAVSSRPIVLARAESSRSAAIALSSGRGVRASCRATRACSLSLSLANPSRCPTKTFRWPPH